MAVQLIKRVRTSQPQQSVEIDWLNPITKGLNLGINFSCVGKNDLTKNAVLSDIMGVKKRGKTGASVQSVADTTPCLTVTRTEYGSEPNTTFIVSNGQPNNGNRKAVFGSSSGNFIGFTSAGNMVIYTNYNEILGTAVLQANTPFTAAWVQKDSNWQTWLNGSLDVNQLTGAYGQVDSIRWVGGIEGYGFDVFDISLLLFWRRVLTQAELVSLHNNPWQIFKPETIPLFYSTVTAQYARPTSDVSTGTWTASSGSDLFAMLDETTASDSDYIVTTSASTCEVALGSLSDPASSAGHIVRYRISATSGGITVRLRQGTTTIATWTHASAPTSLTTYAQTLTSGEADSITDYTALRLQFEAT